MRTRWIEALKTKSCEAFLVTCSKLQVIFHVSQIEALGSPECLLFFQAKNQTEKYTTKRERVSNLHRPSSVTFF